MTRYGGKPERGTGQRLYLPHPSPGRSMPPSPQEMMAMRQQQLRLLTQMVPPQSPNATTPMLPWPLVEAARRNSIPPGSPNSSWSQASSPPSPCESRSSDYSGHYSATSSPAQDAEEQCYVEMLRPFRKYIRPIQKLLTGARMDINMDPDRRTELQHFAKLLDIISNVKKRYPMELLLICQRKLESIDFESAVRENAVQLLLDTIDTNLNSPMFNQTMQKVFEQPVNMLLGPARHDGSSSSRSLPNPKRYRVSPAEENMYDIPEVVQNEVAHLGERFRVQLDPMHRVGAETIKLLCYLDERTLPSVPPIVVAVPGDYPENPPQYFVNKVEYKSTKFFADVLNALRVHMHSMPPQYSITALLEAWEASVRRTVQSRLPSSRSSAHA